MSDIYLSFKRKVRIDIPSNTIWEILGYSKTERRKAGSLQEYVSYWNGQEYISSWKLARESISCWIVDCDGLSILKIGKHRSLRLHTLDWHNRECRNCHRKMENDDIIYRDGQTVNYTVKKNKINYHTQSLGLEKIIWPVITRH